MGGGPTAAQENAANSQANLSNVQAGAAQDALNYVKGQQAKITPFATRRMNQGAPYLRNAGDFAASDSSRAFSPAYAALNRRLANSGPLPQGYADAARRDLDASRASDFDSRLFGVNQAQDESKLQGAQLLTGQQVQANPQSYFQGAAGANQSIMQAPLQKPGLMGLLGGAVSGAASAIPF